MAYGTRISGPVWLLALGLASTSCRCGSASMKAAEPAQGSYQGPDAATPVAAASQRAPSPILWPAETGPVDVTLMVHSDRGRHAISPLIYGVNFAAEPETQRWGVLRWGGNRLTAYNWETNASNAGSDWQYQNDGNVSDDAVPAGPFIEAIDTASRIGAAAIVTISNSDYVSADKNGGGDVRNSGPNYLKTRFKRNLPKKPGPFELPPNVRDDAVYQDELVAYLRAQRPGAHVLYSMDNEPELWAHTHAEIFPKPVTYADLWRRNRDFARAVKDVAPDAEVLGFVSYGYAGYVNLQNASDGAGHNFVEWYLDQARAAEVAEGRRLIDYLDVHWYPEAHGDGQRITTTAISKGTVVAREQAPRSLWDRTYEEQSWIRDMIGGPIDLIHWFKTRIRAHYPGTKLAFTEWNYGGGQHISGAIATADVLGIFGKFGVDLATYWGLNPDESFPKAAFRIFRNYDAAGAEFGDTSIEATSSEAIDVTVYASVDSENPDRTVIVAINKTDKAKSAGVKVAHSRSYRSAAQFVLAGDRADIVRVEPSNAVGLNAFVLQLPAQSVSLIVPQP